MNSLALNGSSLPGNPGELLPATKTAIKSRLTELEPLVKEAAVLKSALAALEGQLTLPNPPGRPKGPRA